MAETGFAKVSGGDALLYGPRKLLLCGFAAGAQAKLKTVLDQAGLGDIPIVWAASDEAGTRIGELMALPGGHGSGKDSTLARAVLMAGIKERELHLLMSACRKAGMKNALWAVLTPTSETWALAALLRELTAERAELEKDARDEPEQR